MLENAHARGVRQVICIGTSHQDSLNASAFAESHQDVFWTYGTHPEASNDYEINCKKSKGLVAIGEVGLDYHYPGYDRDEQIRLLEESIDLAIKLSLPCSFHVRDAMSDFFSVVKNFPKLKPSVLHSFSDTKENLEYALENGFYIGVNGLITFAGLDCFKQTTPDFLDHCILETDAPFLTPEPNRGKINEPGISLILPLGYHVNWESRNQKLPRRQPTMQEKSTTFLIPNQPSQAPALNFLELRDQEIYAELNHIAEEIDRCRALILF